LFSARLDDGVRHDCVLRHLHRGLGASYRVLIAQIYGARRPKMNRSA
jgi:hypothetical protein